MGSFSLLLTPCNPLRIWITNKLIVVEEARRCGGGIFWDKYFDIDSKKPPEKENRVTYLAIHSSD